MSWECVVFKLGIAFLVTAILIALIIKCYYKFKLNNEYKLKKEDKDICDLLKKQNEEYKKIQEEYEKLKESK